MPDFMHFGHNLELGITSMDEQRRELVSLINRLATTLCAPPGLSSQAEAEKSPPPHAQPELALVIFKQIEYLLRDQFVCEEALMHTIDYPGQETHLREHKMFLAELSDCLNATCGGKERLNLETLTELKHWLVGHIVDADREFAHYYHQQAENGADETPG